MARLIIDPITRIEGHLRIEIEVDNDTISDAYSSSTAFRGFEIIMRGRDPRDVGLFAQRICGVCTYHHYERGVEATERAYNVRIPPNARLVRNLLWSSQLLSDHIVHFYQLHSMDWWDVLSALSADPARATEVAHRYHDMPYNASESHYRLVATRLTRFAESGQLGPFAGGYWGHENYRFSPEENLILASHYLDCLAVQRLASQAHAIFGGKNPHPQSLMVGGVTSARDALTAERIAEYQFLTQRTMDFVERAYLPDLVMLAERYREEGLAGHGAGLGNYMSFGALPLNEEPWERRVSFLPAGIVMNRDLSTVYEVDPMQIGEEVAHAWYRYSGNQTSLHPLRGETDPVYTGFNQDGTLQAEGKYSWLKAPRYNGLPMEVGPLARFMVGYARGDAGVQELMNGFAERLDLPFEIYYSTLGRTIARGLETKLVGDKTQDFINELATSVSQGDERFFSSHSPADGEGWAMGEAPRGSLSHWLQVSNGQVANYQAIVPTTWNASPRDTRGQLGAYEAALMGQPLADPEQPLEVLRTVHSFDPCMACAVHILNKEGKEIARFEVEV